MRVELSAVRMQGAEDTDLPPCLLADRSMAWVATQNSALSRGLLLLKKATAGGYGESDMGGSLDIENYCTIRTSPACQRRCLWLLSALE